MLLFSDLLVLKIKRLETKVKFLFLLDELFKKDELSKIYIKFLSDRLGGVEHSSSGPNPKYVPVPELDLHAVCLLF